MRIATLVAAVVVVLTLGALSVGAQVSPPAAPTNLEVVAVGEDSITLAWGPSQPGAFYNAGEGKNYVVVAWGPSADTRGPVTYALWRNGQLLASGLGGNAYRVSVPPGKKLLSFRTCVVASLPDGRTSPQTCGTWTR